MLALDRQGGDVFFDEPIRDIPESVVGLRAIGPQLGREIVRDVLGAILGGSRRR